MAERTIECGGCGRLYPSLFPVCPFCYVQQFLEVEAQDGVCPICETQIEPTSCPKCGGRLLDWAPAPYCQDCGYIVATERKGY